MGATPITFDRVLVANRGEIARRILRTLREMGLGSVAIFSDADSAAPHVRESDEAVRIGPAVSDASYLDQDAVIRAAIATGADAIHPGYGFLAENAAFAARCQAEGLVFIGPPPDAIRVMGDKARAKDVATRAGVPVIEGFTARDLAVSEIRERIEALGSPVLIKAVAGGGGKGMRVVHDLSSLKEVLAAAEREAASAFGEGSLMIERLIASPRHIEVQILADSGGRIVHLGDRDCSIQRRHQKIIEEAPAGSLDEDLREQLGAAAVSLARAVAYEGAGTVEFLVESGAEGGDSFFFLEMNTRLQVEHAVTEAITDLDLVRWQIEIAQGRQLPFDQVDITPTGHAIEARLYAEDPCHAFLPSTGRVSLWAVPDLPGLRIESGIEAGDQVTSHYDPLLAKVIGIGATRDEARRRLYRGLSALAIGGLVTNRELLLSVLEDENFKRGAVDTSFLERRPKWQRDLPPETLAILTLAATVFGIVRRKQAGSVLPIGIPIGWRNHRWRASEDVFETAGVRTGDRVVVGYVPAAPDSFTCTVTIGDDSPQQSEPTSHQVTLVTSGTGGAQADQGTTTIEIEIDDVRRRFEIAVGTGHPPVLSVHGLGHVVDLTVVPRFPGPTTSVGVGGCAAPMTGKVVAIEVATGERVTAGSTLVVLEAMKMEHRLEAHADGVVEAIRVEVGSMVDPDTVLVVVRPDNYDANG